MSIYRQTDRQRDRQTEKQRQRYRESERERQTNRHTEQDTDRQRDREPGLRKAGHFVGEIKERETDTISIRPLRGID